MRCGPCHQSQNHTRETSVKYRTCQIWNKNIAFKRLMPYMPGQPIARDTRPRCPLCRGDDSQGHIFGSCMHPDMSKQYIARHDKAMRTVIQAFTKGQCGSHYLIADVGKIEGLKDIGVHAHRQMFTSKGLGPHGGEGFAGGSRRHTEQDEARHDDSGDDNRRTTAVPAPR